MLIKLCSVITAERDKDKYRPDVPAFVSRMIEADVQVNFHFYWIEVMCYNIYKQLYGRL